MSQVEGRKRAQCIYFTDFELFDFKTVIVPQRLDFDQT